MVRSFLDLLLGLLSLGLSRLSVMRSLAPGQVRFVAVDTRERLPRSWLELDARAPSLVSVDTCVSVP
ncbi:MAG TPA: hypothetical protein VFU02_00430 [Polyangiaceae bacterium]|nr:hypothetical protein [Polyangiaceae bacterium]